jgi:hypothetical protein
MSHSYQVFHGISKTDTDRLKIKIVRFLAHKSQLKSTYIHVCTQTQMQKIYPEASCTNHCHQKAADLYCIVKYLLQT